MWYRWLTVMIVMLAMVPGQSRVVKAVGTERAWASGPPNWVPMGMTGRAMLAAVTGQDGRIYTLGGMDFQNCEDSFGCDGLSIVEAYEPKRGVWTSLAPMLDYNYEVAATVGLTGDIYALGAFSAQA